MANTANKRKMSDRDKRTLYLLFSLIIIALAYFMGYSKFQDKKENYETQNNVLQQEVTTLRDMVNQSDEIEKETKKLQDDTEEIFKDFPTEVRIQNAIYQLEKIEKRTRDLNIYSETYTMNQVFYNGSELLMDEDGNVVSVSADESSEGETTDVSASGLRVATRSDITVGFKASYKSLKKLVDYVNDNSDKMNIIDVSVTKQDGERLLECSMIIGMYAVSGTDVQYEQPNVTGIRAGKGEIFK